MAITGQKVAKPSISTEPLAAKIDEINRQFHDFNELHLFIDETGQFIQVNYINEDGFDTSLTSWFNMEQVGTYLHNYQRMFCLDPNRLDVSKKWIKLRPLHLSICSSQQGNGRVELQNCNMGTA